MAQRRNDELIDNLQADFIRAQMPTFVYGEFSGWAEIEIADINDTAQIIIPDTAAATLDWDVKSILGYRFVLIASDGGRTAGVGSIAPGEEAVLYLDQPDSCALRVNTDGSVDIRRTAGVETFDVKLRLDWI